MSFSAFISYSHEADRRIARAMRTALHRFAKPWYRLRALRVFLDESDLSASPGLWSRIEEALNGAGFLILLASPPAARSPWVRKELEHWLSGKSADRLLIVLTSGEMNWNTQNSDFDWTTTTSLPDTLRGRFTEEPRYVDMRSCGDPAMWLLRQGVFRQCIVDIAAPLHNKSRSDLDGEDVQQFRRTKRIASLAIATLTALLAISVALAFYSNAKRQAAEKNERIATSQRLAADSEAVRDLSPQRGLLLATEAAELSLSAGERPTAAAEQALRRGLDAFGGQRLQGEISRFGPLVVSPDGRWLASIGPDNNVLVWDLKKSEAPITLPGHSGWIKQLVFSPDGRWLVSGSVDKTAQIWALRDLRAQAVILRPHGDIVQAVAISPNSKLLATGSHDGYVRIWNFDRVEEPPLQISHPDPDAYSTRPSLARIDSVIFSPDGRRLLAAGAGSVWIHHLEDFAAEPVLVRQRGMSRVATTNDGRYLISTSDSEISIWETDHLDQPPRVLKPRFSRISAFAVGRASAQLAVAAVGGEVEIWNLDDLDGESNLLPVIQSGITEIAFVPGDIYLIAAGRDKTLALRNIKDGGALTTHSLRLRGHDDQLEALAMTPDGHFVFSSSADATVRRWNMSHPLTSPHILSGAQHTVTCIAVAKASARIATGDLDGQIRVWDTNQLLKPPLILMNDAPVRAIAMSTDGEFLIAGDDYTHEARIWDLRAPAKPRFVFDARNSTFRSLAISTDGKWLAMDGGLAEATLWNFKSGKEEPVFHSELETAVEALAFSADSSTLGTVSGWEVRFRSLQHLAEPPVIRKTTAKLTAIASSPDGRLLAVGDDKGAILLFDPRDAQESVILRGHRSTISALTISPDATRLASVDNDSMRIWNLDAISESPIVMSRNLEVAAYSADGRWLIGTEGYSVLLWNANIRDLMEVASHVVGRNLSEAEWQEHFGVRPYKQTFSGLTVPPSSPRIEVFSGDSEDLSAR